MQLKCVFLGNKQAKQTNRSKSDWQDINIGLVSCKSRFLKAFFSFWTRTRYFCATNFTIPLRTPSEAIQYVTCKLSWIVVIVLFADRVERNIQPSLRNFLK